MKSISWIEFLITFSVFIIIFYILFDTLRILTINTKIQLDYVDYFQKYLLSSYYYLQTGEINKIKDFLIAQNTVLFTQEYPEFVKIPYKANHCFNCIYVYYNLYDNSINIIQNASLAYRSRLDIKIITKKNFNNITNNSEIKCNIYLDIYEENILFCSVYLYGNSSVKIYPARDFIYFNLIDSSLDLYDGNYFYKGMRQQSFPYYVKRAFEFYTNKGESIIKNIFILN